MRKLIFVVFLLWTSSALASDLSLNELVDAGVYYISGLLGLIAGGVWLTYWNISKLDKLNDISNQLSELYELNKLREISQTLEEISKKLDKSKHWNDPI